MFFKAAILYIFLCSSLSHTLSGVPAAGRAAGEYKSAACHWQSDLLGVHTSGKLLQFRGKHIGKHRGSQPGGVGVHQEEKRFRAEDSGTQSDKRMDGVLDLPDLAFGSSSVGWRIHDYGVIMIAPADLPFHELHAVVHQPAYGGF